MPIRAEVRTAARAAAQPAPQTRPAVQAQPLATARPLAAAGLSDQLAAHLRGDIESGDLLPGARLPTELALAAQFAVSRTVVREAVSRLRSVGLLVARQGSGVFVAPAGAARPLAFDAAVLANLGAVLDMVEVRRALESEVAALAAQRATAAQRQHLQLALQRVDDSVASGSATIDEDLAFHQAIAEASGNPQFVRLLQHLEQYLRDAMTVTRRNESQKPEYMAQVRSEHRAIVAAILARSPAAARAASTEHMVQAARRLQDADAPIRRGLGGAAQAVHHAKSDKSTQPTLPTLPTQPTLPTLPIQPTQPRPARRITLPPTQGSPR